MLSPFECLCGNFILPEPASYVFFYAFFNLRKLLYIIVAKTVAKVWDDNNNADKKRPDSIQVQLYANGDAVGDPVVLNADGDWKYTWANLDAKKDGQEVSYSVKELEVPKNYKASYSEDGFTITNKLQKDPVKPVTGDTMHLGLWLIGFVVAASALCVGILLKKKTSRKAARHS